MFYGLHGVGKTVLPNERLGSARRAGWICAMVEADTGSKRTPFRARGERATPAERDYLATMAVDGDGPGSTGEVAGRLGEKPTSLGPIRANLIARGLVYPPEHGQIAFTVPGMAAFIRREGISE